MSAYDAHVVADAAQVRPSKTRDGSRRAIDVIRDGADKRDLKARGQGAVWNALVSTALSRLNVGGRRADWVADVLDPRSELGRQVRIDGRLKVRSDTAVHKKLNDAWNAAEKRVAESPAWTRAEAREVAQDRAEKLRRVAKDPSTDLNDNERRILVFIADRAVQIGSTSVNAPRLASAMATGIGEKAFRGGLDRLVNKGYLNLLEQGTARTATKPGRANVVGLPDEDALRIAGPPSPALPGRVPRQVGPPPHKTGEPQPRTDTGPAGDVRAHLPEQGLPAVALPSSAISATATSPLLELRNGLERRLNRAVANMIENATRPTSGADEIGTGRGSPAPS